MRRLTTRSWRFVSIIVCIAAVGLLSFAGRLVLDWSIGVFPAWKDVLERLGGGVIGMAIGLMVVIPVFRMYGVFDRGQDELKEKRGAARKGRIGDETKRN